MGFSAVVGDYDGDGWVDVFFGEWQRYLRARVLRVLRVRKRVFPLVKLGACQHIVIPFSRGAG